MASTLSTLDSFTKNVYVEGLPNFVNTARPLWGRLEKVTKREAFSGRQLILGAKESNPQATGGLAEGDTLPTAGNTSVLNMTLAMKYHYGVIKLSKQLMQSATGGRGSFGKAVVLEMDGIRDQLVEDLAIHGSFGDGYGAIAEATSYTSATVTLKSQNTSGTTTVGAFGSRALRKNMTVSSYSAKSAGSQGADHKTISAVGSNTAVTVPTSAGFNSNDYLFRSVAAGVDPRDKVMMGLGGICDDGTRRGTIQNLSRTTYPSLKANKLGNSGTLRAWTPELMDQLVSESWLNGGGKAPTALYSPLEIQQRAAAYLRNDRRYDMATKTLDGGYRAVEWTSSTGNGAIPWFVDRYCIPNEIHALHEPDLFLAVQEQAQFEDMDGAIWRFVDRTHSPEAWLYTWLNMGGYQFNNHSYLQDVSHTL